METINYILENGLDALQEDLGIKIKVYDDLDICVLNYSQINSPKTHAVVMECRGLILNMLDWTVLCRPFRRFFNYGEALEIQEDFDFSRAIVHEKVDGSLVKVWYNPLLKMWDVATRGTAFAESDCMGHGVTFRDLIFKAFGVNNQEEFHDLVNVALRKYVTYLFELTCFENRVVTRYEGTKVWYLGAVDNATGKCLTEVFQGRMRSINAHLPRRYRFDDIKECLEMAKTLPDLEEGYVLQDLETNVRVKIKSPAYVAVHHIRGEGLNPKRIKELILSGEQQEYLNYFPEDFSYIQSYLNYYQELLEAISVDWIKFRHIGSQKDFALSVKDKCYQGVLFKARQNHVDPISEWKKLDIRQQYKVLSTFIDLRNK